MAINWITARRNLHGIWIAHKNSLVKRATDYELIKDTPYLALKA